MPPPTFWFKVASLPPDVYGVLKTLKEKQGLSYWQSVILGVHCLVHLAKSQPDVYQGLREAIKMAFPDAPPPGKKPSISLG